MDSDTTSRCSSSRAMPISVSMPNWISGGGVTNAVQWQNCHDGKNLAMGASYHAYTERVLFEGAHRAELDDVFRIEIGQLEPVFRDVRGREKIVLLVFALQSVEQIFPGQMGLFAGLDGAFEDRK